MSGLPEVWEEIRLGSLCHIITGDKDVNQGNPNGKYPFFTCARDITGFDTYSFSGEAILIAGNGFFNVKKFNGEFEAYQRTYVLQDFKVSYQYLYYFIDHRLSDVTKDSRGSTVKYIRIGNLTEYQVCVPPLNEQHRIVAKIEELFSELDKGVESLNTAREQLKVYRQSVLKAAFEGRLTESWRKEHADELESAAELLIRIKAEREARYTAQLAEWQQSGPHQRQKSPQTQKAQGASATIRR